MAEHMNCPKCDADISETYEPDDYECGSTEGWYCDTCDLAVAGWEHPREPMEGDVGIPPAPAAEPFAFTSDNTSGRAVAPDHPDRWKFDNFVRLAKSWGFN